MQENRNKPLYPIRPPWIKAGFQKQQKQQTLLQIQKENVFQEMCLANEQLKGCKGVLSAFLLVLSNAMAKAT